MSDDMREDTLVEASDADTLNNETQTDDGATETSSLIFGKYKDMEAAERGEKERERKLHEQAERIKALEEQAGLKEAITKLAEASASKSEPDNSAELLKARLKEIADDYREDPELAVQKEAELYNAWIADEGRKLRDSISKEIAQIREENALLKNQLGDMNPDYLENKETVDKLVADGMPKAKAIEWAKKMAPKEARVLPTSMNGGIRREGEQKGAYITKEERETLKQAEGLTDEDVDRLEAEFQARAKNGGRLI